MTKARDLANAADVLDDVSATELSYVNGVTSAIQTQLNAKQAVVSGVDDTEIGYLNGVTSAIQTQIDSKIGSASAISPTLIDAKGDLIVGSAADTAARLAVGTNDYVLTADSAATNGVKWAALPASASGLTFIKTQTIGSGVSSVTVSDAFSATYDNYLIVLSGGVSSDATTIGLQLGSTTSGYEVTEWYTTSASSTVASAHGSYTQFYPFKASVNSLSGFCEIQAPYLSKYTSLTSRAQRSVSPYQTADNHATLTNTTSYTAFTLIPGSGTLTGGTIKVYGYQNS